MPYATAMLNPLRAADAAPPPTQMRPRTRVPSMVKKRAFLDAMGEAYTPSAPTPP